MQLKIGVLLVGSLDWESKDYGDACRNELARCQRSLSPHRQNWRQQRLMSSAANEFIVRVPIRYGRLSRSRGNTYTMVFSPECAHRLGTAKIIQCRKTVSSIDDLVSEALELWVAEDKEENRGELSASWGCVTLLTPRAFLDHPDRDKRQKLLDDWAANVSQRDRYGSLQFSPEEEKAAGGSVIVDGRLRISWPERVDGGPLSFDLLLATVTNPNIEYGRRYPTVEENSDAWNKNGHVYYFRCNRLTGIQTSDDEAIEKLLK